MAIAVPIALGFAILRGFMLAVGTVPWALTKLRRAEATQSERSLVVMAASRSILLGLAIVALWFTGRRDALAWALLGDGVLQIVDTLSALTQPRRTVAVLPAILCLLDGCAGIILLGQP